MPHDMFAIGDVFVSVSNGKVQWRHPDGTLNQTLDTGLAGAFTTGMAFDSSGRLYVTDFNANSVSVFNTDGTLDGTFGSGYNSDPESILFDAAGNAYVGQADGTGDILKFDATGNPLASFDVEREARGSDWIDLAADQCTMFYTSEGFQVKRFDVCSNTQLPDFATLPNRAAFALRILSDGGVLVADSVSILRLDSAGNIVQTYDAPGEENWFALNLDPDGTSFWSADFGTSNVYKFDIASGEVLLKFNTGTPSGTVFGLGVNGEQTAATGCPVANPQSCCQVVIDHTTQLMEPAIIGEGLAPTSSSKTVEADIEKVCPEKVVISGVIHSTVTYQAIRQNKSGKKEVIDNTTQEDIPFQCVIDREDANEGNEFHVTGAALLCEVSSDARDTQTIQDPREPNHPEAKLRTAQALSEKFIVKVCIRKGPP